jgi:chromosome segregation ATPase
MALMSMFLLQINTLTRTVKDLQQSVDEKSAEAAKLSAHALTLSQEVVETRKEGETYRLHCTALKSRIEEVEHELLAREASMERLSQHLGTTIEGQDFILEEKEQLLLSLNRAQYKEHRLDDQVRQSKTGRETKCNGCRNQ